MVVLPKWQRKAFEVLKILTFKFQLSKGTQNLGEKNLGRKKSSQLLKLYSITLGCRQGQKCEEKWEWMGIVSPWESETKCPAPAVYSGSLAAQTVKNLLIIQETRFDPWVEKIPRRREWLPTPVFFMGISWTEELDGLQSWGHKESDRT